MRLHESNSSFCRSASPPNSRNSRKSWPAQNPRPSPRSTITRTEESSAASSNALSSEPIIAEDSGLKLSPRLSESVNTPPLCERLTYGGAAFGAGLGFDMPATYHRRAGVRDGAARIGRVLIRRHGDAL